MVKYQHNMTLSRNKIQEATMILIYDAITYSFLENELDVEALLSNFFSTPYDNVNYFVKKSILNFLVNRESILSEIQANLSNWKFENLNRIAQSILILAVTHFRYVEPVEKKIVIDNAVRLAKKYLDDRDYKLINAVLDKTL